LLTIRQQGPAIVLAAGLSLFAGQALAASDECLLRLVKSVDENLTAGEIRQLCEEEQPVAEEASDDSLVLQRVARERVVEGTRSVLVPHRRNYFLPVTYSRNPNVEPFRDALGEIAVGEDLDRLEAKFQISLKFSLARNLFLVEDEIFFGFTAESYWQVYNADVSAPFRESNYEPEVFWVAPLSWRPLGTDAMLLALGYSHESNGRGGELSRGWDRLYANFIFEKDRFVFSLKPWWRIPEDEKSDPMDARGDDNPDITDYMGNFEFTALYRKNEQEIGLMLRNNLGSPYRGAVRLDWTFPLWRGIRGYAQYFNGYGESLIDYNARIERLGIGILLTDLL
jgi:phospholipase A1/A2